MLARKRDFGARIYHPRLAPLVFRPCWVGHPSLTNAVMQVAEQVLGCAGLEVSHPFASTPMLAWLCCMCARRSARCASLFCGAGHVGRNGIDRHGQMGCCVVAEPSYSFRGPRGIVYHCKRRLATVGSKFVRWPKLPCPLPLDIVANDDACALAVCGAVERRILLRRTKLTGSFQYWRRTVPHAQG